MNHFQTGQFFGQTNQTLLLDGVTITDTVYDYKFIDWHYHETPYFSFVTQGHCSDGNKRETFECSTDSLLFHNCQEPHYNTKSGGLSRGFQLEFEPQWCKRFDVEVDNLPPSAKVLHPNIKLCFYNIYKEAKLFDDASSLAIQTLLLESLAMMRGVTASVRHNPPVWVKRLDEILHENFDHLPTLHELANELNLHWAHLSRDFPRYFHCHFGEYIRKIRVEKSLALLRNKNLALTDIAFTCGFADQSHFIRCFKEFNGITPKRFRQII